MDFVVTRFLNIEVHFEISHTHTHTTSLIQILYSIIFLSNLELNIVRMYVIYSHNKYAYIHMYMFMQHHNDTENNQTDAQ